MSLLDQLDSDDGTKHDFGDSDPSKDLVINLSELERPVGELKLDPKEISVNGKSLNELAEDAKRVHETPTGWIAGDEEFDIHYRRYHNGEACDTQRCAQEIQILLGELMGNTDLWARITACSGSNHNPNIPEHQVLGTALIGIVNVYFRGAGVQLLVNKRTMNPGELFKLVKEVSDGYLHPPQSNFFKVLKHVDELDATTSLAMDIFCGRVFGTPGSNGVVSGAQRVLAKHYADILLNILDSIDDSVAVDALIAVVKDSKWKDDPIGLSVYLDSINYQDNLAKFRGNIKTRLGGESMKLFQTFVQMSLLTVDSDGGAFVGSIPKRYLTSSEDRFNEMFSKYTITLATAISDDFPLSTTTRMTPRDIMITYVRYRIAYDAAIAGVDEITEEYTKSRLERRVLHNTLFDYWKKDTVHSRLLRTAAGTHRGRYEGSVEIELSTADTMGLISKLGQSINFGAVYDDNSELIVGEEPKVTTKKVESDNDDSKEPQMEKSIIEEARNARGLQTLTSGELVSNLGCPVDIIPVNDKKKMIRANLASLLVVDNNGTYELCEASSERVVGTMDNNDLNFDQSPIAVMYKSLTKIKPEQFELSDDGGVLMTTEFTDEVTLKFLAASGKLSYESPMTLDAAIKRSITESAPARYNNIWAQTDTSPEFLGVNVSIMIGDVELGVEGTTDTCYPASYYAGNRTPLAWVTMLNTAHSVYETLDEVDLAPCAVVALDRATPAGTVDTSEIRTLHIGNMEVACFPKRVIDAYRSDLELELDPTVNDLGQDDMVAVFGYIANNNVAKLYASAVNLGDKVGGDDDDTEVVSNDIFPAMVNDEPETKPEVPESKLSSENIMDIREFGNGLVDQLESPAPADDPLDLAFGPSVVRGDDDDEESCDAALEHQVNMEELLGDVLDDDGEFKAEAVMSTTHPTVDEAAVADLQEEESKEDDLPVLSAQETRLISYFGIHSDKVFATEAELEKAKERYLEKPTMEDSKVIALNEYISLGTDLTRDEVLLTFAEETMDGVPFVKTRIDGVLALVVNSDGEHAEQAINLFRSLGTATLAGVDTLKAPGHRWAITTRFNEIMNAAIIHVVDVYDCEQEKVEVMETLTPEGEFFTPIELLEASDELLGDDFPALAENVNFLPRALMEISDLTEATIRNLQRQARALNDEKAYGEGLVVIELLNLINDEKEIPRRMKRALTIHAVNLVHNITAKHYPVNYEGTFTPSIKALPTLIGTVSNDIRSALGDAAVHAYYAELQEIDLLAEFSGKVIVLDILSEDIGITIDVANVPSTSIALDLEQDGDVYVYTNDGVMLKYNDDESIARPNLSRIALRQ